MDSKFSFSRLELLKSRLQDALKLTLELKRNFDEGRPISDALSSLPGNGHVIVMRVLS